MPYKDPVAAKACRDRHRNRKALYDAAWYQENRAKKDGQTKRFNARNPERRREYVRSYKDRCKRACFDHYGWACTCCGLAILEFLSIDHIGGGGTQHRKALKGRSIFAWLVKHGLPEGFRVLCFNCNLARGFYGYCPHESAHLAIQDKESARWRKVTI